MKKNGNLASNRRYNPKNTKPNIPIDADEVDGAMERFIREKYQHKTLCGEGRPLPNISQHTGSSSGSSNDAPPPVPAKNPPRLTSTLRSSSAMFPHSPNALPSPPASDFSSNGSRQRMAGIPEDGVPTRDHSFENKLDTLKDMGFPNETRNSTILKGSGGNMNRALETLMKLGEGGDTVFMNSQKNPTVQTNGISIQRTGASHSSTGTTPSSATAQHSQASPNTTNPFYQQHAAPRSAQSMSAFEQSFQNMAISQQPQQQSQPLFPNNTGSWAAQRPQAPGMQNNPFFKTFTPPMSPSPYQYTNQIPQQPTSNPFLRASQSQTFTPSNPFGATQQMQQQQAPVVPQPTGWAQSPQQQNFTPQMQSPIQAQATGVVQSPFATQQSPGVSQQQQVAQSPSAYPMQSSNPYVQQTQQQPVQSPGVYPMQSPNQYTQQPQQQQLPQTYFDPMQQQQQPQQQAFFQQPQVQSYPHSQQRQYYDKNSILALYNTPSTYGQQQQQAQVASPPVQSPQRSVTMPIVNSPSNPFGVLAPATQQPAAAPGHVSRDSMQFMGGRPASPDAFSGLSARYS